MELKTVRGLFIVKFYIFIQQNIVIFIKWVEVNKDCLNDENVK